MAAGRVETATVMFTDLVGSTELRSRVGEESAEIVRSRHDAVVTEAIQAHQPTLVKHLGDGAMATFTAAAEAVAAAVAVQQGIDLHNRHGDGERLAVRIGLSVGDVTFEDGDCFGLPVVEAQRLEGAAEPGTILCADLVVHLARGRGGHEFRPVGELELKGLSDPLAASEVVWTPAAAAASMADADLPSVLSRAGGLPFAGRADRVDELTGAWKRCVAGGFEVGLIAGEPGIGKTRLARQVGRLAQEAAGRVLAGRCDEDVQVPFKAFGMALEWFVDHADPAILAEELGRFPGDLVRLVPHLGDRVVDLPAPLEAEPEAERLRLFQAVESWLAARRDERATLLVLDDLHWADKPTLLLLRHLIDAHPPGLMILCTYRDTDVDRAHPLASVLADLRRLPGVTRMALDGLAFDGVREVLERTGGHDLDEQGLAFAEIVFRETAGNPFFVGELLRHLAETGALVEREGRWVSDAGIDELGVPEGIREVVGRRLDRLGDDTEAVLRAAAVIGYEFDIALLARVVDRSEDDVLDALDLAAASGLAQEVGIDRFRFAHALVRETLHGELSSTRRARQHRKVAQAMEELHGDDLADVVSELAVHWREATVGGDPTRAVELTLEAGVQAMDRGAPENAVGWFEGALEMMEDHDDLGGRRPGVMVLLARAQLLSGDQSGRQTALEAARLALAGDDPAAVHDALLVSSRASFDDQQPEDPEKLAVLREALSDPQRFAPFQRGQLYMTLATELIFLRDEQARNEALEQTERVLPELSVSERGQIQAQILGRGGGFDDRRSVDSRVHDVEAMLAVESDPFLRFSGWQAIGWQALSHGQRDRVDEVLGELRAMHDQARHYLQWSFVLAFESMIAVVDGRLDDAESMGGQMVGFLRDLNQPEYATYRATTTAAVGRERGNLLEGYEFMRRAAVDTPPDSGAKALFAYAELLRGETEHASAMLEAVDVETIPRNAAHPWTIAFFGEVAAATGSEETCARFVETLATAPPIMMTGGIVLGPTARLVARLESRRGRHEEADRTFGEAIGLATSLASPTWIARTQLDRAEALIGQGETERALASVEAARGAIGDLALPDSAGRVDALSRRLVEA